MSEFCGMEINLNNAVQTKKKKKSSDSPEPTPGKPKSTVISSENNTHSSTPAKPS